MIDHPEARIQAWLDGELPPSEASAVENHCRACSRCGDRWRERMDIRERLLSETGAEPLSPMWPAVEERLHRRERFSVRLAFGTSAAAVAGIVIGVLFGSLEAPSSEMEEQDVWSAVGSAVTAESSPGLSGFYLDDEEGGGS